jgi:hydrogenase maturation protease
LSRNLILGYGNPDRQDDGVAWHIQTALLRSLGRPVPPSFEDGLWPDGNNPDFLFTLQLLPENAEIVAGYDRVCFVDAHTGNIKEDFHFERITGIYTQSPFTHHMTPATCIYLVEQIYKKIPEAILVSVRGYEFEFSHTLSSKTQLLAEEAASQILKWLDFKNAE